MNDHKEKVQLQLNTFTTPFKSVIIATKTIEEMPYTSYAPFVKYEGDYYFLISKIAKHFENLSHCSNASIMFIEDETKANNIFFRKRLSYAIKTILNIKDEAIESVFFDKFGDMATMLFKMDFLVVKCQILNGNMILGPGQAYDIDETQRIVNQITNPKGHAKK